MESYDPNIERNEPSASTAPGRVAAVRVRCHRSVYPALGKQRASGSTRGVMTINTAETVGRTERMTTWADRAQFAGLASVGAGAIHLAAAGIHAENPFLARIFVILGAAQVIAGLVLALGGGRPAASVVAVVNIAAVGGWTATRTVGIPWVWGLEHPERPQFADTVCATLGAIALVLAVTVLLRGARQAPRVGLVAPGALVGVVSVAAMLTGATHVHSHDAAGHLHDETAAAATPGADAGHVYAVDTSTWPRPFDPTQPIDFAGVPGVTPEQQARAETLVASTLRDLPQFADVTKIGALGFTSIGDAASGFEHYINLAYIPTTRSSIRTSPNRSSTRSTATSARWSRRCSRPAGCRSPIPSSSTGAVR